MTFVNDKVFDNGLNHLVNNVTDFYICSSEPTTYVEATSTNAIGNKTSPVVNAPSDASPTGREVIVDAILDGVVTATGTATHYALVDSVNSDLLWVEVINPNVAVTLNNTFTHNSVRAKLPDPV